MSSVKRDEPCRVYWGSHGCDLPRGHDGTCICDCCECPDHPNSDPSCVGAAPYYGPYTWFYGEDVAARGLPSMPDEESCDECDTTITGDAFVRASGAALHPGCA